MTRLAEELGFAPAVTMLGAQDQGGLVRLYHQHQVLVFPSEWDEPFGIVLVEAMACGLPVMCSGTGGSAEIVDGATTGLRFRPGDPDDLAAKALELLRHPELRERLAHQGRRRVEQEYDVERMVDAIEDDLLAARGSGTWVAT